MSKLELSPALFKRIALGDDEAFEELYYKTYSQVYAFLLSLTKDPDDAKDLLQDTYIKIRGACHLYKDQSTLMAWILKISKNLFLMKVRKEKDKTTVPIEYAGSAASTFGGIESLETSMCINQLFECVSDDERNIIIMHLVTGLKHREIADLLDMPVGTVLSKYNRGISKLQKATQGKEVK